MAVFKIFPEKDTFIFSDGIASNAGKDEIVELNNYSDIFGTSQQSRILVKFNDNQINSTINSLIGSQSYQANIEYYLAEAHQVPTEFSINAYPLYISGAVEWDNGTGKYGDIPSNKSGVSWKYIQANETNPWISTTPSNVTSSFDSSATGGGTWYTGSNGVDLEGEEVFKLNQELDLSIDVTNAIKQIISGSILNKGFIIKLDEQLEFSENYNTRLKYFGIDTNTIYPPSLTFKWDDSTYNTGSLEVLNTEITSIDITNNKGKYVDEGKQRFRIHSRPKYPERMFTTSSIYLQNYALPEESYWGLKDENTEEMVVDFDENYTKVSCDDRGGFFDIYMNGLQPERFYRILIKTNIDNSSIVVDNENIFKIVRNG